MTSSVNLSRRSLLAGCAAVSAVGLSVPTVAHGLLEDFSDFEILSCITLHHHGAEYMAQWGKAKVYPIVGYDPKVEVEFFKNGKKFASQFWTEGWWTEHEIRSCATQYLTRMATGGPLS